MSQRVTRNFFFSDGKKLVKIGDGGCRGEQWNKKGCPKFVGRVTLEACAKECRNNTYCTAFHVLKFVKADQTYECLMFGHKNVVAIPALGGTCYTLQVPSFQQKEVEVALSMSKLKLKMFQKHFQIFFLNFFFLKKSKKKSKNVVAVPALGGTCYIYTSSTNFSTERS
jgi:hypothetical protein